MCDTCASPRHPDGWRRAFGLLPVLIIVLVGPLLLLQPFGVAGGKARTTQGDNLADRVFIRDLADQAAKGIELGEALVSRAPHPRARARAEGFLARERLERRAAVAAGGTTTCGATRSYAHRSGASLRLAAARHTREDELLARIELMSGRSPRLRTFARNLATREPIVVGASRSAGGPRLSGPARHRPRNQHLEG